jgi:hypothetical protein
MQPVLRLFLARSQEPVGFQNPRLEAVLCFLGLDYISEFREILWALDNVGVMTDAVHFDSWMAEVGRST